MLLFFTDTAQININLSLKMMLSLKWQRVIPYLFFSDLIDANKKKQECKEDIFSHSALHLKVHKGLCILVSNKGSTARSQFVMLFWMYSLKRN